MSKLYIRLLAIAAFVIAVTGASFSIAGLMKLFGGAAVSVGVMASALEFAKLVVTGFLYRYWGHVNRVMQVYLSFAVLTLVGITSVGIYGFLSNAYMVSSLGMKSEELRIEALTQENERVQKRITDIQLFIDEIPRSRISKKFELHKEYAPEIKRLQQESDNRIQEINSAKSKMLQTHTEIGPALYIAKALGKDIDTVVQWLILVFVLVFDPLAVCLVFCLNLAIRLREKYRGNELRIAAHSLTTPVDHRLKKAG